MYYGKNFGKTKEAREWSHKVFHYLSLEDNHRKLLALKKNFNPFNNFYRVELTAFYPEKQIITAKGQLSARSIDLSNWEKPLIDLIFLPKHIQKKPPYGCENLEMDDRYIGQMTSKKTVSKTDDFYIEATIEIIDLKSL